MTGNEQKTDLEWLQTIQDRTEDIRDRLRRQILSQSPGDLHANLIGLVLENQLDLTTMLRRYISRRTNDD